MIRPRSSNPLVSMAAAVVLAGTLAWPSAPARSQAFVRGDANTDGEVSSADAITIRRYLFTGGSPPSCLDAADANDDGLVDIRDEVLILSNLLDPRSSGWSGSFPSPYPDPGSDPTADGLPCDSYTLEPPLDSDDVVRLGEVEAAPGAAVEVPIYLTNSVDIDAIQLVIAYDPDLITPLSFQGPPFVGGLNLEGTYFDRFAGDPKFNPISLVSAHPQEGVITVGLIDSIAYVGYEIQPGEEALVAKILLQVSGTAAPGTTIRLELASGPGGNGTGPYRVRNEIVHRGEARFVAIYPQTVPGALRIVTPDFVDFLRADYNDDGLVDNSDAISCLSYLFLEGGGPTCPDAADVNDDGQIDISDPIHTLMYLYHDMDFLDLGPPLGVCSRDETLDELGICITNRCSRR